MTITRRTTKGTALTYQEMDENFRDLRYDTDLDRVLTNGNTTTKSMTVGDITVSGNLTVNGTSIGVGGGGGGDVSLLGDIFYTNPKTIEANVTVDANTNAMAAGPIEIANGAVLTIESGGSVTIT